MGQPLHAAGIRLGWLTISDTVIVTWAIMAGLWLLAWLVWRRVGFCPFLKKGRLRGILNVPQSETLLGRQPPRVCLRHRQPRPGPCSALLPPRALRQEREERSGE